MIENCYIRTPTHTFNHHFSEQFFLFMYEKKRKKCFCTFKNKSEVKLAGKEKEITFPIFCVLIFEFLSEIIS